MDRFPDDILNAIFNFITCTIKYCAICVRWRRLIVSHPDYIIWRKIRQDMYAHDTSWDERSTNRYIPFYDAICVHGTIKMAQLINFNRVKRLNNRCYIYDCLRNTLNAENFELFKYFADECAAGQGKSKLIYIPCSIAAVSKSSRYGQIYLVEKYNKYGRE